MINIDKGFKDWKELSKIVKQYKSLEDIKNNCKEINYTNYKENEYLDMNYKTICATAILEEGGSPLLSPYGVEVWNEDPEYCDFQLVDFDNKLEEENID